MKKPEKNTYALIVLLCLIFTLTSGCHLLFDSDDDNPATPGGTTLSDLEAVNQDLASLNYNSITFTPGDTAASVSQNVGLPVTGANGTTITWISSNISLLGHSGNVTKPAAGAGDTLVVMLATVSKGTNSAGKQLVFTIVQQNPAGAGASYTYSADGVSFKMVYLPGGLTTPIGVSEASKSKLIPYAFWVGETEVTYQLWYSVYIWATNETRGAGRYTFANPGCGGGVGTGPIVGTNGAPPIAATENQPVTDITWRDCMIWANALTEWYNFHNGTSYDCVYNTDAAFTIPIRTVTNTYSYNPTAGGYDNPYVNINAKGFRLLVSDEWEMAARYKGSDSSYGAIERPVSSGMYWTPGLYSSGATNIATHFAASDQVAWFGDNSGDISHDVKGKDPNLLGLYDMAGNIEEWCFDIENAGTPQRRHRRGGSFESYTRIRTIDFYTCYDKDYTHGLRIGRNH